MKTLKTMEQWISRQTKMKNFEKILGSVSEFSVRVGSARFFVSYSQKN